MAAPSDVIDWQEAMTQCGEDEEFLRELLEDLRTETETQLNNILQTIQNPQDDPYHRIMRAAHVIKGAAANLMCGQLRATAMELETAAAAAHEEGGTASPAPRQAAVAQRVQGLQQAAQNYFNFVQSIGV